MQQQDLPRTQATHSTLSRRAFSLIRYAATVEQTMTSKPVETYKLACKYGAAGEPHKMCARDV